MFHQKIDNILIHTQRFFSRRFFDAGRQVLVHAANRQRIRKLERKYKADFDSFTRQLKGRVTPAQEDDWLNWRSAQSMLDDWQQTYQDLLNDHAR